MFLADWCPTWLLMDQRISRKISYKKKINSIVSKEAFEVLMSEALKLRKVGLDVIAHF